MTTSTLRRIVKRPSSVIGRTLKRRVAMMTHWVFTALAIAISILLASKYDTYIPIIITTMASSLVFLYSVWLKKRILLGNVVVASIATSLIVLALCDVDITNLETSTTGSVVLYLLLL